MLNTQVEGEGLPPELLDGFFLLMVIAGNETTRNTITTSKNVGTSFIILKNLSLYLFFSL